MQLRRDQKALLGAAGVTIPFWVVPLLQPLLLPIALLNTHIHELCHALAALATEGSVMNIYVHADTSGVTHVSGGMTFLVAAAGYVGTSVVGGVMIAGSKAARSARRMLLILAGALAFALLMFVRGDLLGILSAIFWIGTCALGAKKLKDDGAIFAAQFLGFQLCLSSLFSFLTLLNLSWTSGGHSDAKIMENASGVPAMVWATAWMLLSLVVMILSIRSSWRARMKEDTRSTQL